MFAKLRYQACIPVILIGLSLWEVPSSTAEELTSPCVNDAGIALEWQAEVNKVEARGRDSVMKLFGISEHALLMEFVILRL